MDKFLKEKDKIKLQAYDEKSKYDQPIRLLIIGSSGSGKTTLLLNFIYNRLIPYSNLYIFSKSLEQPSYKKLQERFKNIERKVNKKLSYFFSSCEDIIPLSECKKNSLIVFDDCILENQDIIKEYCVMGRHKNISCIYLSQCFSKVDIQLIRNNLNMICIFKQNEHYTKKIYENFVGSDMTFVEFKEICNECWKEDYGFLTINLISKPKYMNKFKDIK